MSAESFPWNVSFTCNPALGFRSLPRNLARGVLSGAVRVPEQRASAYFTRPRPGRKAGRPNKPKIEAMNKRASVAVMTMEAKKMQHDPRRSEDEAILASLEAGRALSPTIPLVRQQPPPGIVGEGDGVACKVFATNQKLLQRICHQKPLIYLHIV